MADIDFDDFDGGYATASGPRVRRYDRFVHLAGAATSVALLLGAITWGYQLAVRDVTGVPVMRALGGAMRVAPADPGGNVAGHQGLSVNAVAAAGTAVPLPDTLFLAPEPQGLAPEDAAGLAQPLDSANLALPEEAPASDAGFAADAPLIATEIPTADQDAVAAALAEALGLSAPSEAAPSEAAQVQPAALVTSLRPMPRPSARAAAGPATEPAPESAGVDPSSAGDAGAAAPVALASVTRLDPSTISVGTRLVQLGAFDDEVSAQSDWARLAGRFPELMADKSMVIEAAQSGGRTFFRLRAAGFADVDESRRFCTVLLAENATCIPVTQR